MGRIIQTAAAESFLEYINASPTPFHAVRNAKQRLLDAGFKVISEKEPWSSLCKPGGKYVLTRNGSTIVAFTIGKKWKPGNPIGIVAAHTDSCALRIKPVSKREGSGYLQVGVETYGGGLWHTWFDRDLGLAGRVMVKDGEGSIVHKLVHINRPILRIPTLAIHFDRQEKFEFNKQDQLFPIAGLVAAELKRQDGAKGEAETDGTDTSTSEEFAPLQATTQRHHSNVVDLIAEDAGVSPDDIVDFEVILYDIQESCLGGLQDEFIFSQRLDNLNQTYCATMGIIESVAESDSLNEDTTIRMIACFDNEEIGSKTRQGADSQILPGIIRRLSVLPTSHFEEADSEKSYDKASDSETAFEQTLAGSFLVSADMAHAVNPNYSGRYEPNHSPEMNKGPVIKINANARYITNSPSIALIQEVAKRAGPLSKEEKPGVPLQLFVIRNDSLCGSTIGPMVSANLGVRGLDIGNAQLSMHSIRETAGTEDVAYAIRLFKSFFEHYGELEKTILAE